MTVYAYRGNFCRNFSDDQLVKNFDFDQFSGQWYPIYRSKDIRTLTGQCPVTNFQRLIGKTKVENNRVARMGNGKDMFCQRNSYKGLAGITDLIRSYKGYFEKGKSTGTLWIGATITKPLKRQLDNF